MPRDEIILILEDDDEPFERKVLSGLRHLIEETAMTQAQIDADTAAILAATQAVSDGVTAIEGELDAGVTAIEAEIAALKDANPAVDTTALDAAVLALTAGTGSALAGLKTSADAVAAIPPPVVTPPPVLAPQAVYEIDGDVVDDPAQWSSAPFTAADDGGRPLFYFAGDTAGGPANGDGVGGVWHVYTGTLANV